MSLKYIMVKKQNRNTKKRGRNNKSRKQRGGKTPTKTDKTPPPTPPPEPRDIHPEDGRKIPDGYERSGRGSIRKVPTCTIS